MNFKIWKPVSIAFLIFLLTSCDGPRGEQGERGEPGTPGIPPLTLNAMKSAVLPVIDGKADDEQWVGAKHLQAGVLSMKAVFTENEIAFLLVWSDRELSINSRGTWNWDPGEENWFTTGSKIDWDSFLGSRHPEWLSIAFDISSKMKYQGCNAFCHENPKDSGKWHHNTEVFGEFVDAWTLLGKHGMGPEYDEDMGWQLGVEEATQSGEIIFGADDPMDLRQPITGTFTFSGYADDKVMVSIDNNDYPKTDTAAAKYCNKCHTELGVPELAKLDGRTFGDAGEIMYYRNSNEKHDLPLYIEKSPVNFADSMVLTQKEIDAGEAVAVATVGTAQITEYWAEYVKVNGVIPEIILKIPSGSQADVKAAATWSNGIWTLELKRSLLTGDKEDDVQFDDLSREYYFTMSLWSHGDLIGPLMGDMSAVLLFGAE